MPYLFFPWTWTNYSTYKVNEINDTNNFSKDSKEIFSIDIDKPSITNYIEAEYQFYLDNSYLPNKDEFYFIILTNLSNNAFINAWSWSIYKDKNKNKNNTNTNQINEIISNNDNIKFNYLNAFGVESDFNEFPIKFEIKYIKKINQFYTRFKIYVWVILIFNFRL